MSDLIPRAPFAGKDLVPHVSREAQSVAANGVVRSVAIVEDKTQAILERKRTWLTRLWPDEVDRVAKAAEVQMAKTEFDALNKALYLVRTAATQALEESINSVLIKGKGHVRKDTLATLTGQFSELIEQINERSDGFAAAISQRYKAAERIEYEHAREMVLMQCEEQVVVFKTFSDQAIQQFRSLIDEQLKVPKSD